MNLLQLQAELARIPLSHQYNEYSAKGKADILQMFFGFHIYSTTSATIDNKEVFMMQHMHINYYKLQI